MLLSCFSRVWLCVTPETAAHQAPRPRDSPGQEYWSELPFPSPKYENEKWKWSRSVMPDSSRFLGLQPTRLLCPWDFPGKSIGVGCHCLLQCHIVLLLFFTASDFTSITSHIHNCVLFLLWLHFFILSGVISPLISSSILGTYWPGEFTFQCPLFLPFHTVHGVQDKNTKVVCLSLLQWSMFCQNSLQWPIHFGWPYTAWLIFSLS